MSAKTKPLTGDERETNIQFNEVSPTALIQTDNAPLRRQLDALAKTNPGECIRERVDQYGGGFYQIPKSWIRVKPPRVMSDEEKAARALTRNTDFSGSADGQ